MRDYFVPNNPNVNLDVAEVADVGLVAVEPWLVPLVLVLRSWLYMFFRPKSLVVLLK